MRVYAPTTMEGLAAAHAADRLAWSDDVVIAEDASEDGEYAALMTAADLSAALVAGAAGSVRPRRVVVVAEVGAAGEDIELRRVVAVHMDTVDRAPGDDPDDELAWFATQEIPHLI